MAQGLLVECAIIGAQQILGERQPDRDALQFLPEAPAQAFGIFRQIIGRLEATVCSDIIAKAPL
jgi:hypothetical protein